MTVTGRMRVPLPLFSMRFCAARTARGRGGDQPSRPAFRASTVRRSSSRLARQVSSFFRAVVRSTSAERSSAFSWAVERRTARPKESTVRRGLAAGAGLGGGGGQLGGHHPAVSADDAPCVLAVGRDHDVLQKAVLLHFPQNVAKIILS